MARLIILGLINKGASHMQSTLTATAAIAALLVSVTSTSALAAPRKAARVTSSPDSLAQTSVSASSSSSVLKGVMIRPQVGMAFMNPKGLNNELQLAFNNNSAMKVTSGVGFGVSVDYPVVSDAFYLGARMDYFGASSDAITIGNNNPGTARASVTGVPLMLTATYKVPFAPKWSFLASVGGGVAVGYRTSLDVAGSNDANNLPNGTLSYASSPVTGMGMASLGYDLTRSVALRLDAGYRLLSSSQMTATEKYGQVKEGQLLLDRQTSSTNVLVDGSAFFSSLSLAITL